MKFFKDLKDAVKSGEDIEINISLEWHHIAAILVTIALIIVLICKL